MVEIWKVEFQFLVCKTNVMPLYYIPENGTPKKNRTFFYGISDRRSRPLNYRSVNGESRRTRTFVPTLKRRVCWPLTLYSRNLIEQYRASPRYCQPSKWSGWKESNLRLRVPSSVLIQSQLHPVNLLIQPWNKYFIYILLLFSRIHPGAWITA